MTNNPELEGWEQIHNQADKAQGSDIPGGAFTRALERVTRGVVNARLAIADLMHSVSDTKKELGKLNENLKSFNEKSSRLQIWLIIWTAVIAIATVINVLVR